MQQAEVVQDDSQNLGTGTVASLLSALVAEIRGLRKDVAGPKAGGASFGRDDSEIDQTNLKVLGKLEDVNVLSPALENSLNNLQKKLEWHTNYPPLEALVNFTTVATFLAGFTIADFASFNLEDWQEMPSSIVDLYLVLMAFAVGNSMYCSVLGIILITATQRVQNWDIHLIHLITKILDAPEEHASLLSAMGDSVDLNLLDAKHYQGRMGAVKRIVASTYHLGPFPLRSQPDWTVEGKIHGKGFANTLFNAYCEGFSPMSFYGMACFPLAVVSYVAAVLFAALRGHILHYIDRGEGEEATPTLIPLIACPCIIVVGYVLPMLRHCVVLLINVYGNKLSTKA